MRLVPVVLLAVTTPALADSPEPACDVRVVRAPDNVRAAIEARVGIEPTCTKLDVRVIQTRDGYYVVASPPAGEIFEGTVREPGLVGELVTSWARLPHGEPVDDDDDDEVAPKAVAERPPSAAPPLETRDGAAPARRRGTRDLVLGVHASDRGYGVRGEIDVFTGRGFSLGVAIGVSTSSWSYTDEMTPNADLSFQDVRAVIVAAKTFTGGAWRLRLQAGFGVIQTEYTGTLEAFPMVTRPVDGEGTTRMVEAAISVSRDVGSSWALSCGPLLSYYGQQYAFGDEVAQISPTRELDVSGVFSLRRRL